MPTRFDRYRMTDGKTPLAAGYFNPVLSDIDVRLAALEDLKVSWIEALGEVTRFGLDRINIALVPNIELVSALISQARAQLAMLEIDAANLSASVNAALATVELPSAVTCSYDTDGRVSSVTEILPAGTRTTTTAYDLDGRVSIVAITFAGSTRTEIYAYNASGQLTGMTATETATETAA